MKHELDLYWVKSIQHFNRVHVSQKTAEQSPENKIWANGNNSCKNRSGVTKLKPDLFHVTTNSYT